MRWHSASPGGKFSLATRQKYVWENTACIGQKKSVDSAAASPKPIGYVAKAKAVEAPGY
jgi:hypothetical protein